MILSILLSYILLNFAMVDDLCYSDKNLLKA